MMETLAKADENFVKYYCSVCGIIVQHIRTSGARPAYCKLCGQTYVFLQGLICGYALCNLVCTHEGSETRSADLTELAYNTEDHSLAIDQSSLRAVKSETFQTKEKYQPDAERHHLDDLLQVTFDQDCGADTQDGSDQGLEVDTLHSPDDSSSSADPEALVLRSTGGPCQAIMKCTKSNGQLSQAASSLYVAEKRKTMYSLRNPTSVEIISTARQPRVTGPLTMASEFQENVSSSCKDKSLSDSNKKRVECQICGEKFIETHLYVHMKAKHSETLSEETDLMFSCSECNRKFEKQSHLNKHLAKKHPNCKKLTKSCTICHKGFSNQIGLSVHMRHVHKALSPKECELCKKSFKSCKELSRHKLRDHKLRVHICHLCGKNFAYGHALKSHLDAHAGVKKHFCEVCGEGFIRMTSLCGHRISAHSKKDDVAYKCEICESVYTTKALLNKHLFESHFTGPYAIKDYRKQKSMARDLHCQVCKGCGESAGQCPFHSAEDRKQFICSHCGKNFSKSHYLKAHEKQHQEAKFSCDICCKRFTYKCNLKAHRSTHSTDKPFQCPVCSKKFRLKFLLEDHQRTHNRDLLFKCYVCGRGLTRIPNLKRHIRVMHPEVCYEQHMFDMHAYE